MTTDEAAGQGGDAVQPAEQTEVQDHAGSPDPSQTSQGLIEPYLQELDPLLRDKVAPVLERFRADQDANVNKRIEQATSKAKQYEQYGDPERVQVATQILDSFIADPVGTVRWMAERGQEELGVDVLSALTQAQSEVVTEQQQTGSTEAEPITAERIMEILEEREKSKAQEQTRQQAVQRQQQAAIQRARNWFDEAVQRHSIPSEAMTDGIKQSMVIRANELRQQGLAPDGQTAIDMAVSEMGEAFSRARGANGTEQQPNPKVAQGGTAPPAETYDVSDERQRRQAMLDRLTALTGNG